MRTLLRSLLVVLTLVCVSAPFSFAQQKPATKSYVFKGKVQSVGEKGLMVAGEKVEGWMDAMSMMYTVDKPEVLKKVKAGDQIRATVYDGDYTLHDVQVVPQDKK